MARVTQRRARLGRSESTGQPAATAFLEGKTAYGLVDEIVKPEVIYPHDDEWGISGVDSSNWNETFRLSPLTLQLKDSTMKPQRLGPSDLIISLWEDYSDGTIQEYEFRVSLAGVDPATFTREADFTQPITMPCYRRVMGGLKSGSDPKAYTEMSKENCDEWADTRDGDCLSRTGTAAGSAGQTDWMAWKGLPA